MALQRLDDTSATKDTMHDLVTKFNANMTAIDGYTVVVETGSNQQLEYKKYSDGTVEMWGHVDMGTGYPCDQSMQSGLYFSSNFSITYPVALTSASASVIIQALGAGSWPCVWAHPTQKTASGLKACFVCESNDTGQSKSVDVQVRGRWQ